MKYIDFYLTDDETETYLDKLRDLPLVAVSEAKSLLMAGEGYFKHLKLSPHPAHICTTWDVPLLSHKSNSGQKTKDKYSS